MLVGTTSQYQPAQALPAVANSVAPTKNDTPFGSNARERDNSGVQTSPQTSQDSVVSLGNSGAQFNGYESLAAQAQKQRGEEKQAKEQEKAEQKEIQTLKNRDTEVRVHEQAHAAVGGQYAGAPRYEYETGPDGKRYAVGGEVSIDVSVEKDPEDTIDKMQIVRAAALAPAEPSAQDFKVAAEATQKEQRARAELAKQSVHGDKQTLPGTFHSKAIKTFQEYSFSATPAPKAFSAQA